MLVHGGPVRRFVVDGVGDAGVGEHVEIGQMERRALSEYGHGGLLGVLFDAGRGPGVSRDVKGHQTVTERGGARAGADGLAEERAARRMRRARAAPGAASRPRRRARSVGSRTLQRQAEVGPAVDVGEGAEQRDGARSACSRRTRSSAT
jgi:hypothetical protein